MPDVTNEVDQVYKALLAIGSAFFWCFVICVIIAILASLSKDKEDKR
jgi:hypothetical protein